MLANGIMDFLVAQKENQGSSDQEKRLLVNSIFSPGSGAQHREDESIGA